jgi:hypothetical protein
MTDRWHESIDGQVRIYYGTNSTTYIRGDYDGGQWNIAFRSRSQVDIGMILQVQPTTYYYRDESRNRGNGKVYGFIAQ